MMEQHCPICESSVKPNPRYPDYVCKPCLADGVSVKGVTTSLADLRVYEVEGVDCEVKGVPCRATEAHFGGTVVRPR